MALSKNVNHLVYTVDNDLISISALNTDDSEAIESMLLHGVSKLSLQLPKSTEQTFRWAHVMLREWRAKRMPTSRTLVQFS